MHSSLRSVAYLAPFLLAGGSLLVAAERLSNAPKPAESPSSASGQAGQRQREGSQLVDLAGYFKLTSDRATFFAADGEQRFVGLENLNLERIALLVAENPDRLDWIVSGTVTEYRGANYLLVTKAVLKNKQHAASR